MNNITPQLNSEISSIDEIAVRALDSKESMFGLEIKSGVNQTSTYRERIFAAYSSRLKAQEEIRRIEEAIKKGAEEYTVPGESCWMGPEEELVRSVRRRRR